MSRQGKAWTIAILGFILIIVLGFMATGSSRNKNDTSSTDGQETGASKSVEEYKKEQDTIMEEMMADMENIPKSGNASIDFLNGMIPHHQSAVSMSESYLKYGGKNEDLKQLAENVIKTQNEEIEQMKGMVERLESDGSRDEEKEADYLEEYNKMFHLSHTEHDAHTGKDTTQNVDWAFAEGMAMHHQMAVDMSKVILDYTEEDDVKQLAENIIKMQEDEIEQMERILKEVE